MQAEQLILRQEGDVLSIILNRPEQGNVLTAEMGHAIVDALARLDPGVKLVHLSALGDDFCAGRDSPIPLLCPQPSAEVIRQVVADPPLALYDAIKQVPVPVIAQVQGRAVGAGCALACVCDITYCSDDARFAVPEMARDIPPTLVMTALIDRVPVKTLADLVYSQATLDAAGALQAGLVRKVVARASLAAEVEQLVATMCANTASSLRAVKQYLRMAPEMSGPAATHYAAALMATTLSGRF